MSKESSYGELHEQIMEDIIEAMSIPEDSTSGQSVFQRSQRCDAPLVVMGTPKARDNRVMELWVKGGSSCG